MPECRRLDKNLPQHVVDGRRAVCSAIADLPPDSSHGHISSILEPLIHSIVQRGTQGTSDGATKLSKDGDGVTPMMVACDKSHRGCLDFIERKINEEGASGKLQQMIDLMGHPLDRCSDECGGNSAAHLAASSGFAEGVDVLVSVLDSVGFDTGNYSKRPLQAEEDESIDRHQIRDLYLVIVATCNAHDDTPLMIASASGHASFLSHLLGKMFPDGWGKNKLPLPPNSKYDGLSRVRCAFELKNCSGDTALSLACGHGCCEVVNVLINFAVNITYEDLEKSKAIVRKTDEALKLMRQKGRSQMEVYEIRGKNVRRCLVMLQVRQAKIAQENMEDLLSEERQKDLRNEDKSLGRRRKSGPGRATMKPALRLSKSTNRLPDNKNLLQKSSGGDSSGADDAERDTDAPQRTLQIKSTSRDLSRLPTVPGHGTNQDDKNGDIFVSGNEHDATKDEVATTLEAEMESLCLDRSMLLLTPHGMAMKLSPSQLDVIESVLESQLAAVHEARRIQDRLLSQKY